MIQRLIVALTVTVLALSGLASERAGAQGSTQIFQSPQHYYLALGDSVAYGYQDFKKGQVPTSGAAVFNTGYVDDFAAMLRVVQPSIQTVNYACAGETSTSFLQARVCALPTHDPYSGSQMDAALAFLKAHPGQVSPITLTIGVDDLLTLLDACGGKTPAALTCAVPKVSATLQQTGANLIKILGALRQAAPTSEIIVMQYYDPFAMIPSLTSATGPAVQALNNVIAMAAAATGARTADTYTPFNLSPNQPATICRLTLMCPAQDIHPSDAGYAVVAQQVWNASGYARLAGVFVVGFDSSTAGQGNVYFGSGPGCTGLVEVGTMDIHPGTTTHAVVVTGNDLPGTVGDNGVIPGTTYWYETVTASSSGAEIDNNGGSCYSVTLPAM